MKKLLVLVLIVWCALQLRAEMMGQFGVGIDVNGKQSFSNALFSTDSDVKNGASLYGEILSSEELGSGDMIFGLGLEYQIPRELKDLNYDSHKRQFSYLPIYLTGKYVFLQSSISPEIIAQAGYNLPISNNNYEYSAINNLKVSGGFYWGMGAGVYFKPLVVQVMYKSGKSTFTWNNIESLETTSTNTQLSLQLGIRLKSD
ncbi:MAG: hypothetical protein PHY48_00490 [Candidatus Cloacimonetes bacterium]|nr:hypothetical protein [Candidatus Cloacimonadota bacterium]